MVIGFKVRDEYLNHRAIRNWIRDIVAADGSGGKGKGRVVDDGVIREDEREGEGALEQTDRGEYRDVVAQDD